MWGIFFTSKSRGILIGKHFPWIEIENDQTWYAVVFDDQKIIGGLVVRDVPKSKMHSTYKVASLGLVCIDSNYRGQGNAKKLLEAAIKEASVRGYDALTLWTQKSDIYVPHGFKLVDDSVFGLVEMLDINANQGMMNPIVREVLPNEFGLPPFAIGGVLIKSSNAHAIFIQDKTGLILADWIGVETEVIKLLKALPERSWRINAHQGDHLLADLKQEGAKLNITPSRLQMWLPLKNTLSDLDWTKIFRFTVLDRI